MAEAERIIQKSEKREEKRPVVLGYMLRLGE
jgi:hypothetical protein